MDGGCARKIYIFVYNQSDKIHEKIQAIYLESILSELYNVKYGNYLQPKWKSSSSSSHPPIYVYT